MLYGRQRTGQKGAKEATKKKLYAATLAAILANFRMPTKGRRHFEGINCKANNNNKSSTNLCNVTAAEREQRARERARVSMEKRE